MLLEFQDGILFDLVGIFEKDPSTDLITSSSLVKCYIVLQKLLFQIDMNIHIKQKLN
jgi:hypothetical protein